MFAGLESASDIIEVLTTLSLSPTKDDFENIDTKIIPHILEQNKWKYRLRNEKGKNLLFCPISVFPDILT